MKPAWRPEGAVFSEFIEQNSNWMFDELWFCLPIFSPRSFFTKFILVSSCSKRYVKFILLIKYFVLFRNNIYSWICCCSIYLIRPKVNAKLLLSPICNFNYKSFRILTPLKVTQEACKMQVKCHFLRLNI